MAETRHPALLTDSEKARLRELSAKVMGWHRNDPTGGFWWDESGTLMGDFHSPHNPWNPLTDLNQTVMVADTMGNWRLRRDKGLEQPYEGVALIENEHYIEKYTGYSDRPATALLLALAEAGKWRWRDGDN